MINRSVKTNQIGFKYTVDAGNKGVAVLHFLPPTPATTTDGGSSFVPRRFFPCHRFCLPRLYLARGTRGVRGVHARLALALAGGRTAVP